MLITLKPYGIVWSHFTYTCMSTLPNHWHANLPFLMDEGLLSIISAGCGQLVKMLITLEPHINPCLIEDPSRLNWKSVDANKQTKLLHRMVFLDQILFILTLSSHLYAKLWWGSAKHRVCWSRYFSENGHNSWIAPYIWIKLAYLYILTLSRHWYANDDKALLRIRPAGRGQMHITYTLIKISYLYRLALFGMYILAEALQNSTSVHATRTLNSYSVHATNNLKTQTYFLEKFNCMVYMYFDPIIHNSAENTNLLSIHSFWHRIQINLRSLTGRAH